MPKPRARVVDFPVIRPPTGVAGRTFVARHGRRVSPRQRERLRAISLEDAGLAPQVREVAYQLSIGTLFQLSLAWPWQIDRLVRLGGCSVGLLSSVLLAGLDGRIVPKPRCSSVPVSYSPIRELPEPRRPPETIAGRLLTAEEERRLGRRRLADLALSSRARRAVTTVRLGTLAALANAPVWDIRAQRNCGPKTYAELRDLVRSRLDPK